MTKRRFDYYLTRNLTLVRALRGEKPESPPPLSRVGISVSPEEMIQFELCTTNSERWQFILRILHNWNAQYEIVYGPFRTQKRVLNIKAAKRRLDAENRKG